MGRGAGYDQRIFNLQRVDPNLVCGICLDVLQDPVIICAEGHNFCSDCAVAELERCPSCRGKRSRSSTRNQFVRNVVGRLEVTCPTRSLADLRDDGQGHAAHWGDVGRIATQEGHGAPIDSDEYYLSLSIGAPCPSVCDWTGPLEGMAQHLSSECMHAEMECRFKGRGCAFRATRVTLPEHEAQCLWGGCKLCGGSIAHEMIFEDLGQYCGTDCWIDAWRKVGTLSSPLCIQPV